MAVRVATRNFGILDDRDLPAVIAAKHLLLDADRALSLELDVARLDVAARLERLKRWLGEHGEPQATTHRLESIASSRPLSVVMAERIDALRAWAAERTVSAD